MSAVTSALRAAAVAACTLALAIGMAPNAHAGALLAASGLDRYGFDATLELRNFSHFHEEAADSAVRDEVRLDIGWKKKLSENVRASFKLRAQADDAGLANDVVIEIPDNRRDRSILDIAEAEIAARIGRVKVFAGRRIYAWGNADIYNPTDRLNSHDWLDPLDGYRRKEKLASWSLAATMSAGGVELEGVWVPFFSPSRLPHLDSRWVGLDRDTLAGDFPGLEDDFETIVDLAHAPAPSSTLENSQVALRAKATIAGVDGAISYYDGYFDLPELDISTLRPFFPRIHVPGLSLSTTFGSFELHSETAFVIGEDHSSGSRVETVNGVDWFGGAIDALHIQRMLVVLDYIHIGSIGDGDDFIVPFVERAHPLLQQNGFGTRIEIVFGSATSAEVDFFVASSDEPGWYFGPRVIHQLTGDVKLEAGFDTFFGDRTAPLGAWQGSSRFYTNLTLAL